MANLSDLVGFALTVATRYKETSLSLSVLCLVGVLLDPHFLPHNLPLYCQRTYSFPLKELKMVNRLYIARIALVLEPIPEGF